MRDDFGNLPGTFFFISICKWTPKRWTIVFVKDTIPIVLLRPLRHPSIKTVWTLKSKKWILLSNKLRHVSLYYFLRKYIQPKCGYTLCKTVVLYCLVHTKTPKLYPLRQLANLKTPSTWSASPSRLLFPHEIPLFHYSGLCLRVC